LPSHTAYKDKKEPIEKINNRHIKQRRKVILYKVVAIIAQVMWLYLGKEVGLDGRATGMSMLASSSGSPMLDSDSWLDREGTGREAEEVDCCSSGSCDPTP
jgi:hypothetical protein